MSRYYIGVRLAPCYFRSTEILSCFTTPAFSSPQPRLRTGKHLNFPLLSIISPA